MSSCVVPRQWWCATTHTHQKAHCGNLHQTVGLLPVCLVVGGGQGMVTCKGVVKNNVVLLEAGVQLPDGAEVEVRLVEPPLTRQEVFARVRAHPIRRPVGMDEIIAEDKQEREEHLDTWLRP